MVVMVAPPGGDERFYFLAMPEGEVYFLAERREGEMGKLVVYKGKGLVENGREGEMAPRQKENFLMRVENVKK